MTTTDKVLNKRIIPTRSGRYGSRETQDTEG